MAIVRIWSTESMASTRTGSFSFLFSFLVVVVVSASRIARIIGRRNAMLSLWEIAISLCSVCAGPNPVANLTRHVTEPRLIQPPSPADFAIVIHIGWSSHWIKQFPVSTFFISPSPRLCNESNQ